MERRWLPVKRLREPTGDAAALDASPERRRRVAFALESPAARDSQAESGGLQRLAQFAAGVYGGGGAPWRLSSAHSVEDNQAYVNEQLELSTALSEAAEGQRGGRQSHAAPRLNVAALFELVKGCKMDDEREAEAEKLAREVMDVVNYLLHARNQEAERENELSERLRVAEKESARKQNVIESLRGELEAQKQTIAQQQNVFKAKEQALMTERKTLQTEKKALEVQCAKLQGVETAYKAQLRRKDAEYERLRKNLQDSVLRSKKEKRGVSVSKPLPGVGERRKLASSAQSVEAKLSKQIVASLEKKNADLLSQNEKLSNSYNALQRQLESLTGQYKKAVQLFLAQKNKTGGSAELEKLAKAPIDDFIPTPFNMATKQSVPEFISQSMERLTGKLTEFEDAVRAAEPTATNANLKEVVNRLQQKLADAHTIISEQDQLLQASLIGPLSISSSTYYAKSSSAWLSADSTRGMVASTAVESAVEEIENERRALAIQKENMERERQLLQEQALKLDQDRLEFEIQKHDQTAAQFSDSPTYTSLTNREIELYSTPKRASRQRQVPSDKQGKQTSPFHIPVAATPGTAALLRKIGIIAPAEEIE